jgi:hypothetical protein
MKRIAVALSAVVLLSSPSLAQQAQPQPQFPNMSFFITSEGGPDGGNLGGLEGADRICQSLAAKHGAGGKTWRAYLSTQAEGGKPAVNARDRIGKGPWVNAKGVKIASNLDELHDMAKVNLNAGTGLAENGRLIPSRLYSYNMHDILTGSTMDGRAYPPGKDMTCSNWTKNEGKARIGHFDRMSRRETVQGLSWNSAHDTRGCTHAKFRTSGGSGLFYCFAAQ